VNFEKDRVILCYGTSSLVYADVSEEPDDILPPWTFQSHTKYSSPVHLLTVLSAHRQTLAWSSFSWTEANQNAL